MVNIKRIKLFGLVLLLFVLVSCGKQSDIENVELNVENVKELERVEIVESPSLEPASGDNATLREKLMETVLMLSAGDIRVEKTFGELGVLFRDEERFFMDYAKVLNSSVPGQLRGLELNPYSIKQMVEELAFLTDREALEPQFLGVDERGGLLWSKGESGRRVDVDYTLSFVERAVNRFSGNDLAVEVKMVEIEPLLREDIVSKCVDVLGECSIPCNFSSASGQNASHALEMLHESVIYPGKTFSVKEVLAPFSEGNGYVSSTGFLNGFVVDAIGGGVCRVVTTLYGAVLRAELEVVERHCHTKKVSYADVSMDATVSSEKDFVFKNNTAAPIVLLAKELDGNIHISLIGMKDVSAKERKIEFVAQITDVVMQGDDEVIISEDVPYMDYQIIEPGADGCRAVLYRHIYEGGELISVEKVNESLYLPRGSIVIAGKYYE